MKPFSRSTRVGGQIQRVLTEILQKKVNDPRLNMTTITGVKMTRDLKMAYVYFSTYQKQPDTAVIQDGFTSAIGIFKRAIAKETNLRYIPTLKFFHDESFDYGAKIDAVLKSVGEESSARDSHSRE